MAPCPAPFLVTDWFAPTRVDGLILDWLGIRKRRDALQTTYCEHEDALLADHEAKKIAMRASGPDPFATLVTLVCAHGGTSYIVHVTIVSFCAPGTETTATISLDGVAPALPRKSMEAFVAKTFPRVEEWGACPLLSEFAAYKAYAGIPFAMHVPPPFLFPRGPRRA